MYHVLNVATTLPLAGTGTVAYVDLKMVSLPTIRHRDCEVLMAADQKSGRCQQCTKYRSTLRALHARHLTLNSTRLQPISHTTYISLTSEEKNERLRRLHQVARQAQQQVKRLKKKLANTIDIQGVEMDDATHFDLCDIMTQESETVLRAFPEGSFARIFWEQQLDAVSCRDKRGMRWHPLIVKWFLYLRHKSSSEYELLRESRCLTLPSQRTLRDYTHHVKSAIGFSAEVDHQLAQVAQLETSQEFQKYILLLIDEIYVREELVYRKNIGTVVGFMNMGDINTHLLAFERSLK